MEPSGSIVDWTIDQMNYRLNGLNQKLHASQKPSLFRPDESEGKVLNEDFFDYVNRYSNGLVKFDKARALNFDLDADSFQKIFSVFVDDLFEEKGDVKMDLPKKYTKEEFTNRVEKDLIFPLTGVVNTKAVVDGDKLPGLFFSLELDCIGKNGSVYAAKSFDFENVGITTNDKHLSHFHVFASIFESVQAESNSKHNHFFLIGDEPSEIESPNHELWEAVQKNPLIQLVPLEEANKVTTKIISANAEPFFKVYS